MPLAELPADRQDIPSRGCLMSITDAHPTLHVFICVYVMTQVPFLNRSVVVCDVFS